VFGTAIQQDGAVIGGARHVLDKGTVACPFDAGKRRLRWI
jgi:hypothetical protein